VGELNGTFDMMGNVWEWMESPYSDPDYGTDSRRGMRGGAYDGGSLGLASSYRHQPDPYNEYSRFGFRVASEVPEPATLGLLLAGGVALVRRRR
jgi:formylglycine-generating enzyme required for sulfatase activity